MAQAAVVGARCWQLRSKQDAHIRSESILLLLATRWLVIRSTAEVRAYSNARDIIMWPMYIVMAEKLPIHTMHHKLPQHTDQSHTLHVHPQIDFACARARE